MPHELPPLPYPSEALEPHVDAQTMLIHHGKHHAAYVNNLNQALAAHPQLDARPLHELLADLDSIPEAIRNAVRNNGGGHWNHSFFWNLMGPGKGGAPTGKLGDALSAAFDGFDKFKATLETAGLTRFGSGWAWLVVNRSGKLEILSTPNQDTPISTGLRPILGVDVWEHAYYLKYQNRRADYLKAWWNVVDWNAVAAHFDAATR